MIITQNKDKYQCKPRKHELDTSSSKHPHSNSPSERISQENFVKNLPRARFSVEFNRVIFTHLHPLHASFPLPHHNTKFRFSPSTTSDQSSRVWKNCLSEWSRQVFAAFYDPLLSLWLKDFWLWLLEAVWFCPPTCKHVSVTCASNVQRREKNYVRVIREREGGL